LQYVVLSYYYYKLFSLSVTKMTVKVSIPIFLLIAVFISWKIQHITAYNSYELIIQNFLLALWSLLYFKSLMYSENIERLENNPDFYIASGILLFSLSDLILEGVLSYTIKNKLPLSVTLNDLSEILQYVMYCVFIVAMLMGSKHGKQTKEAYFKR